MIEKYKDKLIGVVAISVLAFAFSACKKDRYYEDTGIHPVNYNGSIMKYLSSDTLYFDTLASVIRLAKMEEVFESEEITFFAPPDPSIAKSIQALNRYLRNSGRDTVRKLSDVKPGVWKQMLSLYIFNGRNRLKDYPQVDTLALDTYGGQGYLSRAEVPMNVGVIYNDAVNKKDGNEDNKVVIKYAGSRQLMISYLTDLAEPKSNWSNALVASSDIGTTNGVLHVLQFAKHSFGFDEFEFITKAIESGIGE